MRTFSRNHSQFPAHWLTLGGVDDNVIARSLSTARVDLNPHQVDAAIFALQSLLSIGVILANEDGLGKTIETSLVIAPRWGKR
jgi:hypothetical protein